MKQTFFIWGNGKKSDKSGTQGNSQYGANIKIIPDFTTNPIEQIYVKDNCTLYLAGGELYKEGNLNFETNLNIKSEGIAKKLIQFKWKSLKEAIIDVSLGDNHVLVLTKQGNVYAWGDNYYGQLGLDKNMIPWLSEPEPVKLLNVKSIYAYKNNSFAIDTDNKLWVWGKKEYLGGKIIYNCYKPVNILKNFAIDRLNFSDDCLIAVGRVPEKKEEKELKKEEIAENTKNMEKNLKNIIEDNPKIKIENMLNYVKETDENLKFFINKLSEEDRKLVDVRKKIMTGSNLNNLDDQIIEMQNILMKTINKDTPKLNKQKLSYNETVDLISIVLKSIISGKFQNNLIDNISGNFCTQEKDINKLISQFDAITSNGIFSSMNRSLQTLTNYFLKYKKIEYLVYKMSFHQHLLKSFHCVNLLNVLDFMFKDTDNVEKKLYLLEKSFDSLNFLIEKTNANLKDISVVHSKLNKLNILDDNTTEADKFIYKYVIESTFYVRDLWKILIQNVKELRKAKEKENAMEKVLENYKELHSIQMYLNSISLSNIMIKNKKNKDINDNKTDNPDVEDYNQEKIDEMIKQTDGAIKRLQYLVNKYMDCNYDTFSKVYAYIIIFYLFRR